MRTSLNNTRPVFPILCIGLLLLLGCDADLKRKKDGTYVPPAVCAEQAVLPKVARVWIDETHAIDHSFGDSDVALDPDGNLVFVDSQGNVVRRAHDGSHTVLAERVVLRARGLAYLSTGELVIADSGRGMLVKVYSNGQARILVPHLDYPNGLDVDRDDTIYVSESSRGAISRVNPRSGALTTVAEGLPMSPNGLSFSPDYKTLYCVGSDASVYAMTRDEQGQWGPLTKFVTVPGVVLPCDGKVRGDLCSQDGLAGTCEEDGAGGLICAAGTSCAGKTAGDPCMGRYPGTCEENGEGALECREYQPCDGKAAGDGCYINWQVGACADDGADGLFCRMPQPCDGLSAGDACEEYGNAGTCADDGAGGLFCRMPQPCDGRSAGDACEESGITGVCADEGYGLYCRLPQPCDGLSAGDACEEYGNTGICTDDGGGSLYCVPAGTCDGLSAGDACEEYGNTGVCADDGGGLYCRPVGPCDGKASGDACEEYGSAGICTDDGSGSGNLYCQSLPPCDGKIAGDTCVQYGTSGICTDEGYGLYCRPPQPCDGLSAGDACEEYGTPGICTDGGGGLYCRPPQPCDGLSAGDACEEYGTQGICTDEGYGLYCQQIQPCQVDAAGDACSNYNGNPGFCTDGLFGNLYCQSGAICDGLDAGDTCVDFDLGAPGRCMTADGGLACQLDNPCLAEGDECVGRSGRNARSLPNDAEDRLVVPNNSLGICTLSDAGLLYCVPRGACWGLAVGDACTTDRGTAGTCVDYGGDSLTCEEPVPCAGATAGDACTTYEGQPGSCVDDGYGNLICTVVEPCADARAGDACTTDQGLSGSCVDDGVSGLRCQPDSSCADLSAGDACVRLVDQSPGICAAAAGDLLVCQPTLPCEGRSADEPCKAGGGLSGVCVDLGLGGPLFCDAKGPVGALHAVSTDACGNVYVGDARSRTLWRFTPAGAAELVASHLDGPITGLLWGGGAGSWDKRMLYAVVRGGAAVLAIDLGIPGRPVVAPLRADVLPSTPPDDPAVDCLQLPDAPLSLTELNLPRGYHDVAFDSEGWMVGSTGSALVSVSYDGRFAPFASGVEGAQGMAFLPDGTLVAATPAGLITVAPNGAVDTLLADFTSGYGVTVGPDGRIYAADNTKMIRVDPVTRVAETFLDPLDFNQSWGPRTIAFDQDASVMYVGAFGDSVYVVALDEDLNIVGVPRKLGLVVTGAMFLDGLVVDACGNLYLPHYGDSSLYRVSPDGQTHLFHRWESTTTYGHGGDWGSPVGGWRADAIYMPQPYDGNTVTEVVVGIPGQGY